ncbi:sodium:solute symporter family transporter [Ahniella affigens]|nr:hypothetical protein [Ahniella affigens]
MESKLTPLQGLIFLAIYGLLMIGVTVWVGRRQKQSTPEFLLASRNVGILAGAMSIAASWIWAPALFVSSQKAFEQGLPGAFWFIFPNLAALLLFAPVALRARRLLPNGYTLPQYIRMRHGRGVHILYLIQFFGLQICSFAVQILAGSTLIQSITGLPFMAVATCLVVIVLTYSLMGGLRASVSTDLVQMILILLICAITVPWAVVEAGGIQTVAKGLGGVTGTFTNVLDPWVAYSFGISTTIGLLSGPIGDQMHWQRAYALKRDSDVVKTFVLAAFLFILVPLSLSFLGFLAAAEVANGTLAIDNTQIVGASTVSHLLPDFMLIVFAVMLLAGLCSTLDSILCAFSALTVADVFGGKLSPRDLDNDSGLERVRLARGSMLFAALMGLSIASIPGLQIIHLFLFYGTLRASTLIPSVLTLFWPGLKSRAVFLAVLGSMIFGAPLMAAGTYLKSPHLSVAGSLAVVVIGLTVSVVGSRFYSKSNTTASGL